MMQDCPRGFSEFDGFEGNGLRRIDVSENRATPTQSVKSTGIDWLAFFRNQRIKGAPSNKQ